MLKTSFKIATFGRIELEVVEGEQMLVILELMGLQLKQDMLIKAKLFDFNLFEELKLGVTVLMS